jgi:FlaA1/EpsC-like NDP-sugar epimerase
MFSDSILAILMIFFAFSLRLDYWYWPTNEIRIWLLMSPLLVIPIFYSFGLYQSVVRYIGFNSLVSIFHAVTVYSLLWGIIGYMASISTEFGLIPRSVVFINWMLCIISIGGSRFFAKWLFNKINISTNNVIIYGTGTSGIQLSNALKSTGEYSQVAFIGDDKKQEGMLLNGFPIYLYEDLKKLIDSNDVNQVLIASPSISRSHRMSIIADIEKLDVPVKNVPSFLDIAEGKVKINDLLEINTNELLSRNLVDPDENLLKNNIEKKVVFVTGAGGSIGSELCRQIISSKPKTLILFEISEAALYTIEAELNELAKLRRIELISILGSTLNYSKLKKIFEIYNVQTIYHAAAYKHVPLVELNQSEGVLNNVIGTLECAKASLDSNIETFVLISTDKAVRPTNTMGASKRVAELILQAFSKISQNTCFTMVRFGNVLDSSGSVIPLFRKQIDSGGPVTVTHKDVVRFFMTIPEAVELVIQAGALAEGGDVFLLDMGEPVKINDLAKKMINLSGLKVLDDENPDGDIEIIYTGLRPGEKLYEELLISQNTIKTRHNLIMSAEEKMIDWSKLTLDLMELQEACNNFQHTKVRDLLIKIVPEFEPESPIMDVVYGD